MSARPIGEIVPDIILRAKRVAILAEFIETLESPAYQKSIIMQMWHSGLISTISAENLIEIFGLEAA